MGLEVSLLWFSAISSGPWLVFLGSVLAMGYSVTWIGISQSSVGLVSDQFVSFSLCTLVMWILSLCVLSLTGSPMVGPQGTLVLLSGSMVLSFSVKSLFVFYFWYEVSLVPMALLVLGWGHQPERLLASVYMVFYTLVASIPLFWGVTQLFFSSIMKGGQSVWEGVLAVSLLLSFLVKLPSFSLHLWLPKAHVEAPMVGSMVLAGLMLKLGGYGVLVFWVYLMTVWSSFLVLGAMWGGCVAGLVTLAQSDVKNLVAYSSVVHMAWLLILVCTPVSAVALGAMLVMVGHGLTSAGLFCVGTESYERVKTRTFLVAQGGLVAAPGLGIIWAILAGLNGSAPPSISFMGEVSMGQGVVPLWGSMSVVLAGSVMVSLAYSLFLFSKMYSGPQTSARSVKLSPLIQMLVGVSHLVWHSTGLFVGVTLTGSP